MPDPNRLDDTDLSGDYARDEHQGGFGADYARDGNENSRRSEERGAKRDEPESEDIGKASE